MFSQILEICIFSTNLNVLRIRDMLGNAGRILCLHVLDIHSTFATVECQKQEAQTGDDDKRDDDDSRESTFRN